MDFTIQPRRFCDTVRVPPSKSHTIRRLVIAALADGVSHIGCPLESLDAASCARVCAALGAGIEERRTADGVLAALRVTGLGGPRFSYPKTALDVGNSGTTLFFALAFAALGTAPLTFTGDDQIKRRGAGPLLEALERYGARVSSADGCAPVTVQGPWRGGRASIECPTSQYLSALLLAAPLADAGCVTEIEAPLLNEKPYIAMTLAYLRNEGVRLEYDADFSRFRVPGGQAYRPLNGPVPADFSSAAFPALAALVSGGALTLSGLDPQDTQGDKAFFTMIQEMGAKLRWEEAPEGWALRLEGGASLRGGVFDLNDTPDMLPAACVLGAFASGETALVNVAGARIKETDRIAVMARELAKAGVACRETPDGIVIQGGGFTCARFDGHGDHRVVMALACAALGGRGASVIQGAEAAAVTYPEFLSLLA